MCRRPSRDRASALAVQACTRVFRYRGYNALHRIRLDFLCHSIRAAVSPAISAPLYIGHDSMLTTLCSCGPVSPERQAEIIRTLGQPDAARHSNMATEIAMEVVGLESLLRHPAEDGIAAFIKETHWFALDEDRPLAFFTGIWTTWHGRCEPRPTRWKVSTSCSVSDQDAKAEVGAVHPKAKPSFLRRPRPSRSG
jgi:hypothetical protein